MIDDRFSAQAFISCRADEKNTKRLLKELNKEIEKELFEVVNPIFLKIIEQLNSTGHSLKEYEPATTDSMAYRDDYEKDNSKNYYCKLRVGFDLVISTGYDNLYYSELDGEE